ncbi:MAG: pentapeptide repeat-containing protein, partial [Spirulinaceae cyanobacterium]
MANPTIKRGRKQVSNYHLPQHLPLIARRSTAWLVELSMLAMSALIPYGIGLYVHHHTAQKSVPLHAGLAITKEVTEKTLALPPDPERQPLVAPLTNLLWWTALGTPVIFSAWQLYLLSKTGQTTAKKWFGVRVVTGAGTAPSLKRLLLREGVGRWGMPVGSSYLIWRYLGAFPDLGILLGLTGVMLIAEALSFSGRYHRRSFHDRVAGTYVVNGRDNFTGNSHSTQTARVVEVQTNWQNQESVSPEAKLTTIVLTAKAEERSFSLWRWMRYNPGLTLVIISSGALLAVLGTFVGTQIYIQSQANQREFKQQKNVTFLALIKQLNSNSSQSVEERRGAILALARLEDSRAAPMLVDLLSQEENPTLIEAIKQALVSIGPASLPPLQRLNQSLQHDRETLQKGNSQPEELLVTLRLQTTQRAIAKLLSIYSDQKASFNLNRVNLGYLSTDYNQFTLVLEDTELSQINFRGADLAQASLRGSNFRSPGKDQRWGTYDDAIADLSGANLKKADLRGANLSKVSLNRANLMQATLNRANLSKANLEGANLSSAQIINTNLQGANLQKTSLTGADLGSADFYQANLQGASLGQVQAPGAQFQQANLTQSNWQESNLAEVD